MQVSMKLGEEIYKASQANAGTADASAHNHAESSSQSGEKVMDAEYEEVKKDENK